MEGHLSDTYGGLSLVSGSPKPFKSMRAAHMLSGTQAALSLKLERKNSLSLIPFENNALVSDISLSSVAMDVDIFNIKLKYHSVDEQDHGAGSSGKKLRRHRWNASVNSLSVAIVHCARLLKWPSLRVWRRHNEVGRKVDHFQSARRCSQRQHDMVDGTCASRDSPLGLPVERAALARASVHGTRKRSLEVGVRGAGTTPAENVPCHFDCDLGPRLQSGSHSDCRNGQHCDCTALGTEGQQSGHTSKGRARAEGRARKARNAKNGRGKNPKHAKSKREREGDT